MEAVIPMSRRKSLLHPKLLPANYQIRSDQITEKSQGKWETYKILSVGFENHSFDNKMRNFTVNFESRSSINGKSLAEINRLKNRHLMKHPLVESNSSTIKTHSSLIQTKNSEDPVSLLQYQKMLKESKKLEVEHRQRSKSKPIIEIIEGQMCFTEIQTAQKSHVKFKVESEDEKSVKNTKSILRKCQSDNIITEKHSLKNELISDHQTRRLTHDHRANSLNAGGFSSTMTPKPLKLLPGRPMHLTEKTLNANFQTKPLPPISRQVSQEPFSTKYIDHLVTMKNNTNFYYSTKTNTIFPKIKTKEPNNLAVIRKKYAKNKRKISMNYSKNHPISPEEFFSISIGINKEMKGKLFNQAPSAGHCNSPTHMESSDDENCGFMVPQIQLETFSPSNSYKENDVAQIDQYENGYKYFLYK